MRMAYQDRAMEFAALLIERYVFLKAGEGQTLH